MKPTFILRLKVKFVISAIQNLGIHYFQVESQGGFMYRVVLSKSICFILKSIFKNRVNFLNQIIGLVFAALMSICLWYFLKMSHYHFRYYLNWQIMLTLLQYFAYLNLHLKCTIFYIYCANFVCTFWAAIK